MHGLKADSDPPWNMLFDNFILKKQYVFEALAVFSIELKSKDDRCTSSLLTATANIVFLVTTYKSQGTTAFPLSLLFIPPCLTPHFLTPPALPKLLSASLTITAAESLMSRKFPELICKVPILLLMAHYHHATNCGQLKVTHLFIK